MPARLLTVVAIVCALAAAAHADPLYAALGARAGGVPHVGFVTAGSLELGTRRADGLLLWGRVDVGHDATAMSGRTALRFDDELVGAGWSWCDGDISCATLGLGAGRVAWSSEMHLAFAAPASLEFDLTRHVALRLGIELLAVATGVD